MRLGFVTLFPETIAAYMGASILGRAAAAGRISWRVANPRDFAYDPHRKVDDTPYGGHPGMLMKAEPVALALESLGLEGATVVVTEPSGRPFRQIDAERLAVGSSIVFVCGHYEGIDHRFEEAYATEVLSVGDFVLTGGELPALVMADAIARRVPGVLGAAGSLDEDSFSASAGAGLSAPNYTRPEVWRGHRIPEVLKSGDHKRIQAWRDEQSRLRTAERRPDMSQ